MSMVSYGNYLKRLGTKAFLEWAMDANGGTLQSSHFLTLIYNTSQLHQREINNVNFNVRKRHEQLREKCHTERSVLLHLLHDEVIFPELPAKFIATLKEHNVPINLLAKYLLGVCMKEDWDQLKEYETEHLKHYILVDNHSDSAAMWNLSLVFKEHLYVEDLAVIEKYLTNSKV